MRETLGQTKGTVTPTPFRTPITYWPACRGWAQSGRMALMAGRCCWMSVPTDQSSALPPKYPVQTTRIPEVSPSTGWSGTWKTNISHIQRQKKEGQTHLVVPDSAGHVQEQSMGLLLPQCPFTSSDGKPPDFHQIFLVCDCDVLL